ncbi:MAG TPA: hypothetical protein ENI60_09335 [Candidatus Fraserbacteria bacterium]|nr:hypothetical protein [Candidatus Fraserbacteria bacterium]
MQNWEGPGEAEVEQASTLLAEGGERCQQCWAFSRALGGLIEELGPWQIAHFLAMTQNAEAAQALRRYLRSSDPDYANHVAQLIEATDWSQQSPELARGFGSD